MKNENKLWKIQRTDFFNIILKITEKYLLNEIKKCMYFNTFLVAVNRIFKNVHLGRNIYLCFKKVCNGHLT